MPACPTISDAPIQAAQIVAAEYGWEAPTSMTLVAQGAMGRIWRLRTATASYAVKELLWTVADPDTESVAAAQVDFCAAAIRAGVLAPHNLQTRGGHYLLALPGRFDGIVVRSYSWVDGSLMVGREAEAAEWLGRTLAAIERMDVRCSGRNVDPWFVEVPSESHWPALAARAEAAGVIWAARLRDAIGMLVDLGPHVSAPDPTELVMTHTDLRPQNVLVDDAGHFVLLDWDDAGPLSRDRVVASALVAWHVHDGKTDTEAIRRTLAAYRASGGRARLTDADVFGELIAGSLNYLNGQAGIALDDQQGCKIRAAANDQVIELLAHPIDLHAFTPILSA
ncbi:MAG: phosphotransferase [Mycobacteriales bacterium]